MDNLACRPQATNCSVIDRPHPARCSHVPPQHHLHQAEVPAHTRRPNARSRQPVARDPAGVPAHSRQPVARDPAGVPARSRQPVACDPAGVPARGRRLVDAGPAKVPACARRSIADRRPAPGLSPPATVPPGRCPSPVVPRPGPGFARSRPMGSTAGAANSHPSPGRGRAHRPGPPGVPSPAPGPERRRLRDSSDCVRGGAQVSRCSRRPPAPSRRTSTTVPVDPPAHNRIPTRTASRRGPRPGGGCIAAWPAPSCWAAPRRQRRHSVSGATASAARRRQRHRGLGALRRGRHSGAGGTRGAGRGLASPRSGVGAVWRGRIAVWDVRLSTAWWWGVPGCRLAREARYGLGPAVGRGERRGGPCRR